MGRSCGGERTAGGFATGEKMPWPLLLGRRRFVLAVTRRAAITVPVPAMVAAVPVAEATAAAIAVTEAETAIVAFAIPVDLAHHRRRTFLVLVHAHGEIAQHVLAE